MRRLFERFRTMVRRQGRVSIYPQKSRIICMVRVRFAGASTLKSSLRVHLWLKQRRAHPALVRVDVLPPGEYIHHFRFHRLSELDAGFAALLREAYRVGQGARR